MISTLNYPHFSSEDCEIRGTEGLLDSLKTSPPSGLIRIVPEDLLSDGGVALATPTAEKELMDGSGEPGAAGILGKSSLSRTLEGECLWHSPRKVCR